MLFLGVLDALVDVTASGHQVVVGLLDLVLLNLDPRPHKIKLILKVGLLRLSRLPHPLGQVAEDLGVALQTLLRVGDPCLHFQCFGAQDGGMRLNIVQCAHKGEVQLVVGGLHRGLCEGLFLGSIRESR